MSMQFRLELANNSSAEIHVTSSLAFTLGFPSKLRLLHDSRISVLDALFLLATLFAMPLLISLAEDRQHTFWDM